MNPANPVHVASLKPLESAARALKVQLHPVWVQESRDFERAFSALTQQRVDALVVLPEGMFLTQRDLIVALAARHRLVTLYGVTDFVEAGGLMAYGVSVPCGQNPERHQARRPSRRAVHEGRAGDQQPNRQGPPPYDPAVAPRTRGPDNRMSLGVDGASNMALERPAGSHPLAAAAHCPRSADRHLYQMGTAQPLDSDVG